MSGPVGLPTAPGAVSDAEVASAAITAAAATGPESERGAGRDVPVLPAGWPMVPRSEPLGPAEGVRDVIDGTGPRRASAERPTGPGQPGVGRGSAAASGATGVDPAAAAYAMLDALFARAPVGLALLDRAGRFLRVNETLARLDRRPARDHLGRTVSEVLGDTGQELDNLLGRVLLTGEPVVDLEVGVAGAVGAPARTWLASWFPVSEPQLGPVGVAFVALDVTGMQAAERERVRVEARYRALVDAGGTDVFHAGADGGLDVDLPGWRAVTGQRPADLTGSGWLAGVHPDDRDRVARAWHGALERGEVFEAEFRLAEPTAGGGTGPRIVAARVLPVPAATGAGAGGDAPRAGDGRPPEWLGVVRDLTAQRGADAARAEATGRADAAEARALATEQQVQASGQRAETAEQRADAAEARARTAEERRDAAEQRVRAAEQQAEAVGQQAEAVEQRAQAAQRLVEALGQQVEAAEQRAGTAEQLVEALGQQVEAAEQRAGTAEQLIGAAEQRAGTAERLIEAAEARAGAAEARIEDAERRAGSATEDVEAAEGRIRAAERRAEVADLRAQAAVDRAEAADARAQETDDRAEAAERQVEAARRQAEESAEQLEQATRRVDAVVEQAAAAGRRAEEARAQAQAADGRVESSGRFSAALAAAGTVDEVVVALLGTGGQAARALSRGVALVDPDRDELRFVRVPQGASTGAGRPASWPDVALGAVHPVAEVVRGGRALFLADREELLTRWPITGLADTVAAAGEQAWALLPLVGADGSPFGVVTFGFPASRAFDAAERAHLAGLAAAAARAIGRATDHERLLADLAEGEDALNAARAQRVARERADARLDLLTRATATVTAAGDPHQALRAFVSLLADEVADVCALHLVVEPSGAPGAPAIVPGAVPAPAALSAMGAAVSPETSVIADGDIANTDGGGGPGGGAGVRAQADAGAGSEVGAGSDGSTGSDGGARPDAVAGTEPPAQPAAEPAGSGDGRFAPHLVPFAVADAPRAGAVREAGVSAPPAAAWAAALAAPANPFRQVAVDGVGRILIHAAGGWDPPADVARWLRQVDAHTTAVLPVPGPGGVAAVVSLTLTGDRAPFGADDVAFLTELAARAGTALARLDQDRSVRGEAAGLHETLRGARAAVPAGLQVAARYLPAGGAGAAGGEWSDLIDLGAGRVALVIGEAGGGGVAATAAMAQLRAAARACARLDLPPGDVLALLDSVVADLPGEQGATCIYAIAELDTGVLTLASAGHPPPVVVAPDGLVSRLYMAVGAPLGAAGADVAAPGAATEYTVRLGPGYLIALFTDGLVRAGGRDSDAGVSDLAAALARAGDGRGGDGRGGSLDALVTAACAGLGRGGDPAADDDAVALLFARLPDESMAGPVLLDVAVEGAASLRAVRAQGRLALENAGLPAEIVDTIVLVLSELTSNAVRHGRPPLSVRLRRLGTRAVVEVADGGGRLPRRRHAAADDEAGRGLDLVSQLAARHGIRPVVDGKVVWAEVELTAPPAPAGE
ncbi:SpoIIE family protein phosphatase [Frankia canadensis]|nr:SpoIIE family protein phosphatase [Frankia canadensis]